MRETLQLVDRARVQVERLMSSSGLIQADDDDNKIFDKKKIDELVKYYFCIIILFTGLLKPIVRSGVRFVSQIPKKCEHFQLKFSKNMPTFHIVDLIVNTI